MVIFEGCRWKCIYWIGGMYNLSTYSGIGNDGDINPEFQNYLNIFLPQMLVFIDIFIIS